jgi:hypothetical protein
LQLLAEVVCLHCWIDAAVVGVVAVPEIWLEGQPSDTVPMTLPLEQHLLVQLPQQKPVFLSKKHNFKYFKEI